MTGWQIHATNQGSSYYWAGSYYSGESESAKTYTHEGEAKSTLNRLRINDSRLDPDERMNPSLVESPL